MTALDAVSPSIAGDATANLVGAVARICQSDRTIAVHDLYDEVGGALYDWLAFVAYDTTTPASLVAQTGGPVLDLACGSGRIGLAIARRGHPIVGVDLSAAMLERFAARLAAEPADVAARVELVQDDLHRFERRERFALAVLGAGTVVLVDPELRRSFFARVRNHLRPGGTFALDISPCDLAALGRRPERLGAVELGAGTGTAGFALCSQHFDVRRRQERVSFLVEQIGALELRRSVVTTRKWIVTPAEVEADLRSTGFEVRTRPAAGTAVDTYQWLIATAPTDPAGPSGSEPAPNHD